MPTPFAVCFNTLCLFVLLLAPTHAVDNETKDWIRYPAISPDGKQVCFSHRGDLWLVPSEGGKASLLTTHTAYEKSPVWSRDGQWIAFASDRHGNFDVFLIPASGGDAKRLTYHSSVDIPTDFSNDGREVLFTSKRLDAPEAAIGSGAMGELYSISVDGGRPKQILTTDAEYANWDSTGKRLVFHDYKGYEDNWRKHHQSSVTRDVWTVDTATGAYTKLTGFVGEDRNPLWSPDDQSIFYLSEKSGTFNVWRMPAAGGEPEQVTQHATHPVRFLSQSNDGTLCYTYNSELWIKPPAGEPKRVPVNLVRDNRSNDIETRTFREEATEMAVSPNEEEIAFVVRGEVFVANIEFGTTKRITNSPEQERTICWAPDGRSIYYAGERNGSWDIFKTRITRDEEERFAYSTLLTEEVVLAGPEETFQPLVSPDGTKLLFLENRIELKLLDLGTKEQRTLVQGKKNFSYTDGDIAYNWSPDSKWVCCTYHGHHRWIEEIGMIHIATGEITNVSNSGYAENSPLFSRNGDALLYISDRYGMRSHGSWGSDQDIFAFYLNQQTFDKMTLSKEDYERLHKKKDDASEKDKSDKPDKDKDATKKDDDILKIVEPIQVDLTDRELRTKRLTMYSSSISSYDISPDGETLITISQIEESWDLWVTKIREKTTYKAIALDKDSGFVKFSKDGKGAFLLQNGKLSKLDLSEALKPGGKATAKPVAFAAEMQLDMPRERAYMFEHAWRQSLQKFYDPKLHGVEWTALKHNYGAFLPTITNNHDFAEMLGEMLGELNASHTGGRFRPKPTGDQTASLGLIYDTKYDGVGFKVGEVIKRGPVAKAASKIKPGAIILSIDGVRLEANVNPWQQLNNKADKNVRLGLLDPTTNAEWEEVIKPTSLGEETGLLYERWIAKRRELCEKLSGGRIGYVHVQGMNDSSFRRVYSEVLGENSEKEALLVDTRFNGGGWLHDHLVTFLSGKDYVYFVPREKEKGDLGAEPFGKWTRPVAVLQSESNYSDAHFFPWAFKELGIGKLIGAPVPGTATAVWWETMIDPSMVFGIPQVGMVDRAGKYLENAQLEPDVLVLNDPESMARGEDKQLAKAVEVLLDSLPKK